MVRHKLSRLSGARIVRTLRSAGFEVVRVRGSHHILRSSTDPKRKIIVPVHGSTELPTGTLRSVIKQSGLSIDEFMKLF